MQSVILELEGAVGYAKLIALSRILTVTYCSEPNIESAMVVDVTGENYSIDYAERVLL
ncbi:hypothetical protein [Bombiscardovia coagulans]|uniref:Uncharacterized protein n=1 Tax=Bombiscardovia coagulans TaxID=686666 RepID=A0A261EPI1_9BIFI|nr:hypothetical protein [Bombiscardovia coagulans]OZG48762.1 hypothetical protein BOCO_1249 [Bombiscardovia coagulans]